MAHHLILNVSATNHALRLLVDLENATDRTESKLARAQKRMDYFLRKAEESRWTVYVLIAVLFFLVMLLLIL